MNEELEQTENALVEPAELGGEEVSSRPELEQDEEDGEEGQEEEGEDPDQDGA